METTRGEVGEVGGPPLAAPENLGEVREREAREAASVLGASDIFFLPFIDPQMEINGVAPHIEVPLNDFAADIKPWHETKVAAVQCHKTQHAMFLRNTGAPSVDFLAWETELFHMWRGQIPKALSISQP